MILSKTEQSRAIEMAWEHRTPFEAIEHPFDLSETQVILLMRKSLQRSSFERWRKRINGRQTKHGRIRDPLIIRAYCPAQYKQC